MALYVKRLVPCFGIQEFPNLVRVSTAVHIATEIHPTEAMKESS
jgi:hypothetical protein